MFEVCMDMQLKAELLVTRSDSYCTVYTHQIFWLPWLLCFCVLSLCCDGRGCCDGGQI